MEIFNKIFDYDFKHKKVLVEGLSDELKSIYLSKIKNNDILVVCSSLFEAGNVYQTLSNYNNKILFFPMDDFLSSEKIALNEEFKTTRIETLQKLSQSKTQNVVITNLMGYLRYLPSLNEWKKNLITFKEKEKNEYSEIVKKLLQSGYNKTTIVSATGEFSVRGYILDIFPVFAENPIRIEFFDNEIESIREFNVDDQMSINKIREINIIPFSENIYKKEKANIKTYLNKPIVVYKDYNMLKISNEKIKTDIKEYQEGSNINDFMLDLHEIKTENELYFLESYDEIQNQQIETKYKYNSFEATKYYGDLNKAKQDIEKLIKDKKTVVVCSKNNKQTTELINFWGSEFCIITKADNIIENRLNIIEMEINRGFGINNYVFISQYELFDIKERKVNYKTDYKFSTKLRDLEKLQIGDYLVHSIHGIGMYAGLKVLSISGIKKDYIEIIYKDSDKLYIPVEKINLLSKFSSKEGVKPKINKLGTTEWAKTKIRVKKRIAEIAKKLLSISASREASLGFAFEADTEEQSLFESEFIYELTEDQKTAIFEIKEDMEKNKPMDRLLCGDVGFGKTEVAFRAAFKAVSNSKQVMYLCPTTILSNQQYYNALERFRDYPINIGLLNRFISTRKVNQILEDFKNGKIDILFGTHRILSNDVNPKDLGLLIVDEEQRFGVSHKEKIKEIKNNVDILSLSATPIPRTLQMSLIGLRSLSLIETPPINRYPIATYITPFNKQVIKDAIYNELSRGGQVFILYNKINSMNKKVDELQRLVKEAKITYAHGGMGKFDLEKKMLEFTEKKFDVLVCTTIIETGIDIPNVNTLIIVDADNFGLSQLYQIRGRVGRSNKIAYAYLMYDDRKTLTETAVKRLNTIKEFNKLGSGIKIANRDLSIRGAGDILGSEQAGFIDTIGIDLYMKMLNEEVLKIKGVEIIEGDLEEEVPLLNVSTHIKNSYVDDNDLVIEIHKIINTINSIEKLETSKIKLEDRFGKIDEDMNVYMHQCLFEKQARKIGISKINQTNKFIEIFINRENSVKIDGQKLFLEALKISNNFTFVYKAQQIRIKLNITKLEKHFIFYALKLVELIEKLT